MFAAQRRRAILERLRSRGRASLGELTAAVEASEVTVRRDLRALAEEGLIVRTRGGAEIAPGSPAGGDAAGGRRSGRRPEQRPHGPDDGADDRTDDRADGADDRTDDRADGDDDPDGLMVGRDHASGLGRDDGDPLAGAKLAIAELAATLVDEGDAVLLGAGTTVRQLADRVVDVPGLTVVTNSLLVGEALARSPRAGVVMTGGSLDGSSYALVGSAAEQSLAGLRARRAFLSGDGLTTEWGLSVAAMSNAGVDRAIAQAAQEVLVLADATKLGRDSLFQTVPPGRIAHLVTDEHADPAVLARFAQAGVTVHVAAVPAPS